MSQQPWQLMSIACYADGMEDREAPSPQETGAAFGAMLLGGTIVDGPPPPGSPLARIFALSDAYDAGQITAEEMRDGITRIQNEDAGEEPA